MRTEEGRKAQQQGAMNSHTGDSNLKRSLSIYKKRFNKAYTKLIELGITKETIGILFGISRNCPIGRKGDPDFELAYQGALSELENKLTGRLISQSVGYDYVETKSVSKKNKDGKWRIVEKQKIKKHFPGSAQSFQFLMTNRFGQNWKISREQINKKESYDSHPGSRARKQINALARDIIKK